MLKYGKYFSAAAIGLAIYVIAMLIFKIPIDPIMGSIVAGAIVLIMSSSDLRKIRSQFQEMRSQVAEYIADKDANKFIENHSNFIDNANDEAVKNMAMLNLGGAYADIGEFDKAREIIEEIDMKAFGKKNLNNATVNIIILKYRIGDWDEGDADYDRAFNDKLPSGILYEIVDVLRHRNNEDSLRRLSDMNLKEENKAYGNLISTAKMLLAKGIDQDVRI